MMSEDEMGLDTFKEKENGLRYVGLDDYDDNEMRIRLIKPMVRQ